MGTAGHGGDIVGLNTTDWDVQNVVEQLVRDAQARLDFMCSPAGKLLRELFPEDISLDDTF